MRAMIRSAALAALFWASATVGGLAQGLTGPGMLPDAFNATSAAFGNLVTVATAASARTSLGLGTGNSPTFTGLSLGIASINANELLSLNANSGNAPAGPATTLLHIVGANATNPRLLIDGFGANPQFLFRTAKGTLASPTTVTSGTSLGAFAAVAWDGSVYSGTASSFGFNADENWTSTAHGTRIIFSNVALGATSSIERMRIAAGGNTGIGNTNPLALLSIGTTAATSWTLNTFTDPSNYENAYNGDWGVSANVATYGTGKAGTGASRGVQIQTGGTNAITISTGQVVALPAVATGTPTASLCIDASNNIIKKTTAGSCI